MIQKQIKNVDSAEARIEKADKVVKSIERIFIMICIAAILLFILWRLAENSDGFGSIVLIGGIAVIAVLAMIEILLIEKHRHQN